MMKGGTTRILASVIARSLPGVSRVTVENLTADLFENLRSRDVDLRSLESLSGASMSHIERILQRISFQDGEDVDMVASRLIVIGELSEQPTNRLAQVADVLHHPSLNASGLNMLAIMDMLTSPNLEGFSDFLDSFNQRFPDGVGSNGESLLQSLLSVNPDRREGFADFLAERMAISEQLPALMSPFIESDPQSIISTASNLAISEREEYLSSLRQRVVDLLADDALFQAEQQEQAE